MQMNRTQFRQLSKQGKLYTEQELRAFAYKTGQDIMTRTVNDFCAVMTLALRDRLGFGQKRVEEFIKFVSGKMNDLEKGLITIEDIKEAIKSEIGVEIK